jgi:hypothetical protein
LGGNALSCAQILDESAAAAEMNFLWIQFQREIAAKRAT